MARSTAVKPATYHLAWTPEQVAGQLGLEFAGHGAVVHAQSSHGVSGVLTSKQKPSWLVAILLWFICIIPMIIYLINHSKDVSEPFSVALEPVGGGTRINVSGQGRAVAMVHYTLEQLGADPLTPPGVVDVDPVGGTSAHADAPFESYSPSPADAFGSSGVAGRWDQEPLAPSPAPLAPRDGWYPDPLDPNRIRYWHEAAWTQHTDHRPGGRPSVFGGRPPGPPGSAVSGSFARATQGAFGSGDSGGGTPISGWPLAVLLGIAILGAGFLPFVSAGPFGGSTRLIQSWYGTPLVLVALGACAGGLLASRGSTAGLALAVGSALGFAPFGLAYGELTANSFGIGDSSFGSSPGPGAFAMLVAIVAGVGVLVVGARMQSSFEDGYQAPSAIGVVAVVGAAIYVVQHLRAPYPGADVWQGDLVLDGTRLLTIAAVAVPAGFALALRTRTTFALLIGGLIMPTSAWATAVLWDQGSIGSAPGSQHMQIAAVGLVASACAGVFGLLAPPIDDDIRAISSNGGPAAQALNGAAMVTGIVGVLGLGLVVATG